MLLLIFAILSIIAAVTVYFVCFGTVAQLYWIPVIFAGSYLGLLLLFMLSAQVCVLFVSLKKSYRKHNPLFRFYLNSIIDAANFGLRIKIHVTGKEILPKEKFLVVGNHRCFMDPLVLMSVLRSWHTGLVAAAEVIFNYPLINKLLYRNFCIPIDRGNARSGIKMVNEAAEIIKSQVASIGIYPEGAINETDGQLLPFKNGAFKIAKKANCPIVVAVIKGGETLKKNYPFKRTHVYLKFVAVIPPEEVAEETTQQIGERVREIINKNFFNQ